MKMVSLFLALLFLLGYLGGCALIRVAQQPKLGQFEYTHKVVYDKPPIRVIPIWVDKTFGDADRLAIDDALRSWNYALNGYIHLEVVDTQFDMEINKIVKQVNQGGWLILKVKSDNSMVKRHDDNMEEGLHTLGFVEDVGGHHMYLVRDRLKNDMVEGLVRHEAGHLLGSRHVGDHLMNYKFSLAGNQCVDWETIQAVAEYQRIPADRLNFCVDTDRSGE